MKRPENQRKVLEFGFRPGNPDVAVGAPIVAANGVDPDQPATLLDVPTPPVMIDLLDQWAEQRKSARVLIVLDVSGSMGELADPDTGETRLDLAKRAAIEALDQFKDEDEVGLRIFTTERGRDRRGDPRRRADRSHRAEQGGAAPGDRQPAAPRRHAALPGDAHVLPGGARRPTTPTASTRSCCSPTASTTTATPTTTRRRSATMLRGPALDPGRDRQARAHLPDRLRARTPTRRAAHDRRGHQLGRLQRHRPQDDRRVFTAVVSNF